MWEYGGPFPGREAVCTLGNRLDADAEDEEVGVVMDAKGKELVLVPPVTVGATAPP